MAPNQEEAVVLLLERLGLGRSIERVLSVLNQQQRSQEGGEVPQGGQEEGGDAQNMIYEIFRREQVRRRGRG
jgi:hypothetical protein